MLFRGQPNLFITDSQTGLPLFTFDENGLYETENEKLIPRLKIHFEVVERPETIPEQVPEPAPESVTNPTPEATPLVPAAKPKPRKPRPNKPKAKR